MVSEESIREEIVDAVASFLVCARQIRGRDDVFERALWREIVARADTLTAGVAAHEG